MRVHHVRYSSIPLWSLLLHRFLVIVSHVDVVGRRSPRLYCIIANNKFISLCNGRIHFTFQDRFSPSGKRKCFWPLHWGRHGLTCMVRPKAKPHCAKTTEEPPVCCLLALAHRLRHRLFFVCGFILFVSRSARHCVRFSRHIRWLNGVNGVDGGDPSHLLFH